MEKEREEEDAIISECGTAIRMRHHHLKTTADIGIPESVLTELTAGFPIVHEAATVFAPFASKAVSIVCREVENMLSATTPEHRVRCVSLIIGALRETVPLDQKNSTECRMFLLKLASHFVFPLMLHCTMRYLHRALATLVRTVYVIDEELESCFSEAFVTSHIRCWISGNSKQPAIFDERAAAVLSDAEALGRLEDSVMSWVNCIDSTTIVAMPIFPQVFAKTFFDVLPILGESLQWMVANACARCRQVEVDNVSSGRTLLGEDLAYVRHGIRVITKYVHKFLYLVKNVLDNGDTIKIDIMRKNVGKLLSPALVMLLSPVFPKDVLNGSGLLVSSLLTLRTCDPWLLLEVCRWCGAPGPRTDLVGTTNVVTEIYPSMVVLETFVQGLVQLVCSDNPQRESIEHPQTKHALQSLLNALTDNGRFALLKGLLAHLSTPLYGSVDSLGILLRPIIPVVQEGFSSEAVVVVHDVIMPAAEAYCSSLQAPDTRFMALQTIDGVIRHISSVLTCIIDILELPFNGNDKVTRKVVKRNILRGDGENTLTVSQRQELLRFCAQTPKLTRTLNLATEVILGMWDDNTLQVAGPLYDAYNEILTVHTVLKRCLALVSPEASAISLDENAFDTTRALHRVLCIPNERRGKYHALLGLLNTLSLTRFLSVLTEHYSRKGDVISEVMGLRSFSRMLLFGACNNKVGNIAGEVFAKVVGCIQQVDDASLGNKALLMEGVIEPLVESLLVPDYASPLHLNEAVCISNIVTHMITPCLKREKVFVSILLSQLVQGLNSKKNFSRVSQSIVKIIYRARMVGRDISAYTHPNSRTFQAVVACLQAQESELRHTALGLCVLSTKMAEMVLPWQCRMMEWYLSTNIHCGGDCVATRHFLEVYKKWMRRLADSYGNQNNKQQRGMEGSETAKEYKQLVVNHCVRTVSCIIPHIGESPKWCRHLSLERRVAAMSAYTCLLRSVLDFLPKTQAQELNDQLFPPVLIQGLLECLSEGWEKARSCAFNILILYSNYAPSSLFSPVALGHSAVASAAKRELQRARTYRKSEGNVLRYVLAVHFAPSAKQEATDHPLQVCKERVKVLEQEVGLLRKKLAELRVKGAKGIYEFIQQHPLHGSISLCAALLFNAWEVKRDAHVVCEACNTLLLCCSEVLQTCSFLVGTESSNIVNCSEVEVDCRGHVFDKDGNFSEKKMRTVVNNTWLSIRTSAAAVERVMGLVKVEDLSLSVIRELCYVLIESLLRTKHNGVMRKVRQVLKTVFAALLRSRDATFRILPSEMLDFLLGPDGVRSNSVARMLRRSQGLPHAMLAVLEAEDPTVPVFLFSKAMKALLQVATGAHIDSGDLYEVNDETFRSQRSNALNVLKFIFENKAFASRSVADLEEAFWIAASGFDDSSWGIRNSSLMLFSAVLPRFVGEHPSTGGVGVNTSLHEIAVRAPRGVAFVYEELQRSCESSTPSLGVFPLLQMLSMLTPEPPHLLTNATAAVTTTTTITTTTTNSNNDKDNNNNTNTVLGTDADSSRVIRAVMRCGFSKNLMIRAASAVALTSLVPPAYLENLLMEILSTLSNTKANANTMHGALLHLQQFHFFYVGTLRRNMRTKAMNSNATPTVAALVNRIVVKGLGANVLVSMNSKLYYACVHCSTIASTFLSLASDALYFCQGVGNRDDNIPLLNLARLGIAVFHNIVCAPTRSYEIARHDHAAVNECGTFFALLAVRLLSFSNNEVGTPLEMSDYIWHALRDVFGSKNGDFFLSHVMEHLSHYTAERRWSREESEQIIRQFNVQLHCDLTFTALRMLLQELEQESFQQGSSCTDLMRMKAHLKYFVTLCSDEDLYSTVNEELCVKVEGLLLKWMDPNTVRSLRNTGVQSWAIRFLGRCCVRHGAPSETFLRILAHYSHSFFTVQNRAAVLATLNNGLLLSHVDDKNCSNTDVTHRCAFLLLLLRLLLDDAHEVRMGSCRVVSQLTSQDYLSLDHTTCMLSLVYHIRQCGKLGVLSMAMLQQYLLTGGASEGGAVCDKDGDSDDGNDDESERAEDSESEESCVLFEKEADNMFAEDSLLAYLVKVLLQDENNNSPTFTVYDELLRVIEQKGSAVLLYNTLFDDKLEKNEEYNVNIE